MRESFLRNAAASSVWIRLGESWDYFRCSRGVLKLASSVFGGKLLKDSTRREQHPVHLDLPAHNENGFELLMHILHYNHDYLPYRLESNELVELAKLSEIYEVDDIVKMHLVYKRWVSSQEELGWLGPISDWLLVTNRFQFTNEFDELRRLLAMDMRLRDDGKFVDRSGEVIKKDDILDDDVLEGAKTLRIDILKALLRKAYSIQQATMSSNPCHHKDKKCHTLITGDLTLGFDGLKMLPKKLKASDIPDSVFTFSRSLMKITFKTHQPAKGSKDHRRCRTNVGLKKAVRECFAHYLKPDVLEQRLARK